MAVVVLWGGWATAVAAWGPCGPPQGQQRCPRHLGGWYVGWVGMGRGVVVARARTVAARLLCWWLIFPRSAGKQERRCNGVKMASTEVAEVAGGLGHGVHSLQAPQTPATAQASANCSKPGPWVLAQKRAAMIWCWWVMEEIGETLRGEGEGWKGVG